MQYPLISEYVAAIKDAAGNLNKLANLKPVLDNGDEPIHSSGAFAVVFKMVDDNGKYYALKCFTEEQIDRAKAYKLIAEELEIVNSSYMLNVEYYDKELFVDSNVTEDTEFPVLLMDWVDGETMDKFVADNYADEYEMSWLCYRFCKMAAWLRSQPFAHGDLKPDNIIVREDGELVLIDYDGMFVPAMKGQKSPTLGTKDFVHPNRKVEDFDETIDDFTLASIALSLKAISLDSSLYETYAKPDRLLFSSADYLDLSKCEVLSAFHSLMNDADLVKLKGLFEYSLALGNLSSVSFRSFVLTKPVVEKTCKYTLEELKAMTKVSDDELEEVVWDETGAKYSSDGKRLLRVIEYLYETFTIRKGVLVVCDGAFFNCYDLTKITIPDSVTSIGDSAFSGCSGLTEIIIPESITSIGDSAFHSCYGLTEITIPESVTSIGDSAFYRCCGLTEITIPESVTSIGDSAFGGCSSLTEIIIPESITSIGDSAFDHCDLIKITIPDSVTSIGDSAFGYNALTEITIPDSVTSISARAFEGCALTEITIPKNVTSIGKQAFGGCSDSTIIRVDIDNFVYDSRDNCNAIIESKNNKLICACKNTVIPKSITSIGDYAFSWCSGLTEITIPDSVTSIGSGAFLGCRGLTEITIPDSVTSIGERAFYDCRGLTVIKVDIDNIIYDSRNDCNAIIESKNNKLICACKNTVIPENVTSIGKSAFYGCSGLTEITIPSSVTSIGDSAFASCYGLTEITIPDSVTSIGDYAFSGCSGLTEITIPSSVTSIGDYAFSGCSGLTEITIPSSVTSIGDSVFSSCYGLTKITIPDSVTSIGDSVFAYCYGLTEITIPESVISIADSVFAYCSHLKKILIPVGTRDKFIKVLGMELSHLIIEQ